MELTLTTGDLLTVIAVMISAFTLASSLHKNRQQRHRAEAQRVRDALGVLIAKLARWSEISSSLYIRIQPAAVNADAKAADGVDLEQIRDDFWSACWIAREATLERIIEENIETAYADLYGYDDRVYLIYKHSLAQLKMVSRTRFHDLIITTQAEIIDTLANGASPPGSAVLGNRLRGTISIVESAHDAQTAEIVHHFETQMREVLSLTDEQLVEKDFDLDTGTFEMRAAEVSTRGLLQKTEVMRAVSDQAILCLPGDDARGSHVRPCIDCGGTGIVQRGNGVAACLSCGASYDGKDDLINRLRGTAADR
ncbi:MAG: hypothetical protein AAF467_12665 [Actinomycetota bacterium]